MEHGNIVITHLCTLRTPWSVPVYESHTSEKTRPDGVCWLGGGRLISLHSDKLCSVDMPPALNKPVAAPRVESIASTVLDRRRIKCMKKCITRAFLMFLLHSVSWHIFCPELHVGIPFTSLYAAVQLHFFLQLCISTVAEKQYPSGVLCIQIKGYYRFSAFACRDRVGNKCEEATER